MSWKRVQKRVVASQRIPEFKAMDIGEDEEEVIVVPTQIPSTEPVERPQVPQEPVKQPERRTAWKSIVSDVGDSPVADQGIGPGGKKKVIDGEIVGYRHGQPARKNGQWVLHSPIQPMPWEPGQVTASCGAGKSHEAPDKDCKCGLYAKWDEGKIASEFGNHEWITQVQAWGRVIKGSKGFRAQHMQITGIRPPKCQQCEEPAKYVISANPDTLSGLPVCAEHKPDTISGGSIKVHAQSVDDVAKSLSDYYHAEVRQHGETWGTEDMADFEKDFAGEQAYGWKRDGFKAVKGTWARIGRRIQK